MKKKLSERMEKYLKTRWRAFPEGAAKVVSAIQESELLRMDPFDYMRASTGFSGGAWGDLLTTLEQTYREGGIPHYDYRAHPEGERRGRPINPENKLRRVRRDVLNIALEIETELPNVAEKLREAVK